VTRVHVRVEGVVQGVGFRPFVHRLAGELGLAGFVRNDARGVEIEAEGASEALARFLAGLRDGAPPLAVVDAVRAVDVAPRGGTGFEIARSAGGTPDALVTADAATCEACLAELDDPADRRFRYPFVNCTNCGPRFTIVRGVPYDRPLTTMRDFQMCAACQAEYDDPGDRRFHAQPNACPACGPQVRLVGEAPAGRDPVERLARALCDGAIAAVKGIGGYHLACRADDPGAVERLRARKHREERPFALMAPGMAAVHELVVLTDADVALLTSPARPIVLAPRRPAAPVAPAVAPGVRELGVMLPYSPLHHLLLAGAGGALVLTSGNVSDEPIAYRDDDALERLAAIADVVAVHDRPIHIRTDDSVVRAVRGRPTVLRRSRGLTPAALGLPVGCPRPVLAVGAELKSTFCVARGARAWVGHHIGDLRNAETLASFREGIAHFQRLFDVRPEVVAHDLHPDYLSTSHALEIDGVELVGVQHHHAHLAACLAEHGALDRAVGAIYDGTGYGTDGTAWGGEILRGDLCGFERIGHLHPVRLPGGDRAVHEPWRMACSWLVAAHGEAPPVPPALRATVDGERWEAVAQMALTGFAAPQTTSMGRLFDAVAALCGVRPVVSYEGQAAIELEALADPAERGAYPLAADLDARELVAAAARDAAAGVGAPAISARLHRAVAHATAAACAAADSEIAVLSGGVFQNRLLLSWTAERLEALGLRPLIPERLPVNDAGISYGQAAIAACASLRARSPACPAPGSPADPPRP
jgi:hydrogenase maturation protein HypF